MIVISPIMHIVIRSIHNIFTVLFSDKARFEGGGTKQNETDKKTGQLRNTGGVEREGKKERWGAQR